MLKRVALKAGKLAANAMARGRYDVPSSERLVSFTFDDFPQTAAGRGAEILRGVGGRGTYYICMGRLGSMSPSGRIVGAEGIADLVAEGHEFGCHTFSHVSCGLMSPKRLQGECARNRAAFQDLAGADLETFAYPLGHYGPQSRHTVGKLFRGARSVGWGINRLGCDPYALKSNALYEHHGAEAALARVEELTKGGGWLVFHTHDVSAEPSPYGCSSELFTRVVLACAERGIEIVSVSEGLDRSRPSA